MSYLSITSITLLSDGKDVLQSIASVISVTDRLWG
jgi:hypothetical protein